MANSKPVEPSPIHPECIFPKSCAIREFTGDGVSVGRCWFHVGDNDVCPRHGDVREVMTRHRETGKLTDDPRRAGGAVGK